MSEPSRQQQRRVTVFLKVCVPLSCRCLPHLFPLLFATLDDYPTFHCNVQSRLWNWATNGCQRTAKPCSRRTIFVAVQSRVIDLFGHGAPKEFGKRICDRTSIDTQLGRARIPCCGRRVIPQWAAFCTQKCYAERHRCCRCGHGRHGCVQVVVVVVDLFIVSVVAAAPVVFCCL